MQEFERRAILTILHLFLPLQRIFSYFPYKETHHDDRGNFRFFFMCFTVLCVNAILCFPFAFSMVLIALTGHLVTILC